MPQWKELGDENFKAAQELIRLRRYRSCVSRAYYAIYCAATEGVLARTPDRTFRYGRKNPPHEQVASLIQNEAKPSVPSRRIREKLAQDFEVLRQYRETADYRPAARIGEEEATRCLQMARALIKRLGRA